MESGPAVLWDDQTYEELQPTPLMDASLYQLTAPDLDPIDASLQGTYDQAQAALEELSGQTFNLYPDLETAGNYLGSPDAVAPDVNDPELDQGALDVEGALSDAQGQVPNFVDPPTDPGDGIDVPPPPTIPNVPPIDGPPVA